MKLQYLMLFLVFYPLCSEVTPAAERTNGAALPERKARYYQQNMESIERFGKRLIKEGKVEPWPNLGVRSLIDQVYVLSAARCWVKEEGAAAAAAALPGKKLALETIPMDLCVPLLQLAEDMQDKDEKSVTYGNFRWYWRTPEVTDRNAVEFVLSHALPVWLSLREELPDEARAIMERFLLRSIDGCVNHRVPADYTNIALFNVVHLLVLGEQFDRPDILAEGEKRLNAVLFAFWDHGAAEYVSPTYSAVDFDALHFGIRYVKNPTARKKLETMLEYFWTDMALNWYTPSLRLSGSQSRTYNYLYGTGGANRIMEFVNLAPPVERTTDPTYVGEFMTADRPAAKVLELTNKYPRLIQQRWKEDNAAFRTTYITRRLALGTAAKSYGRAMQDMTLTVDLADYPDDIRFAEKPPAYLPRCYFIADGREDPYGMRSYPTSTAGHGKALHMLPFWTAAQRTVDALGVCYYTPPALKEPVLTNVQSHFVFRAPEAIWVGGKPVVIAPSPEEAEKFKQAEEAAKKEKKPTPLFSEISVDVGREPVVLRYGDRVIGLRVLHGTTQGGQTARVRLVNDGNKRGVYRLTADHWENPMPPLTDFSDAAPKPTGLDLTTVKETPAFVLWLRIGENLKDEAACKKWAEAFAQAKVNKLEVTSDRFDIEVAGQDGKLGAVGSNPDTPQERLVISPPMPKGILLCNGKEMAKNILERDMNLGDYAQRLTRVSAAIDGRDKLIQAETGVAVSRDDTIDYPKASGKAIRVNTPYHWQLEVRKAGTYYLWVRAIGVDPEHDSVNIQWSKLNEEDRLSDTIRGEWHLGNSRGQEPTWRWVELRFDNKPPSVPLELEQGRYRLTISPREPDALLDAIFITADPKKKPNDDLLRK